jgi:hypothetical protein
MALTAESECHDADRKHRQHGADLWSARAHRSLTRKTAFATLAIVQLDGGVLSEAETVSEANFGA